MDPTTSRAAAYWNDPQRRSLPARARWWQFPTIHAHINRMTTGQAISGAHAGFHHLIEQAASRGPFARAVSVGCGTGVMEMELVVAGLVGELHLYEISSVRIAAGRKHAETLGITDKVFFHETDAFADCRDRTFDLVYWHDALHHMPDTEMAVAWSRERLRSGGIFAMNDFVGPSRFQWTDRMLDFGTRFRQGLPDRYLVAPGDPARSIPREVRRPTVEFMITQDPSEAADSDRIIPSLKATFPDVLIRLTGGVIYHSALNDILSNIDEQADEGLLKTALLLDESLTLLGETHYAVAMATR
ncbi:class I SAM-dependent methyltransferase [Prosthecomicrobium hirschii]|uniref:class I SAM-dependent methyltransferase n=1 Tax=Prosthecodimorpha hirschii TaxID=665126 RepID=UPI002220962F|nr:class I SAM-dependent methyltransferase [Prosthecomicrobium hirschii]MCW1841781.1 class I SAM-dependent methyltransferase [Prosthecomicrobium hirschii]